MWASNWSECELQIDLNESSELNVFELQVDLWIELRIENQVSLKLSSMWAPNWTQCELQIELLSAPIWSLNWAPNWKPSDPFDAWIKPRLSLSGQSGRPAVNCTFMKYIISCWKCFWTFYFCLFHSNILPWKISLITHFSILLCHFGFMWLRRRRFRSLVCFVKPLNIL